MIIIYVIGDVITSRMESLESNIFNCANESRGFHNKKSVHNVVEGRDFFGHYYFRF